MQCNILQVELLHYLSSRLIQCFPCIEMAYVCLLTNLGTYSVCTIQRTSNWVIYSVYLEVIQNYLLKVLRYFSFHTGSDLISPSPKKYLWLYLAWQIRLFKVSSYDVSGPQSILTSMLMHGFGTRVTEDQKWYTVFLIRAVLSTNCPILGWWAA